MVGKSEESCNPSTRLIVNGLPAAESFVGTAVSKEQKKLGKGEWNYTLWADPKQDGVNGNETVYQENVVFDRSRYKPCQFNGQPC